MKALIGVGILMMVAGFLMFLSAMYIGPGTKWGDRLAVSAGFLWIAPGVCAAIAGAICLIAA